MIVPWAHVVITLIAQFMLCVLQGLSTFDTYQALHLTVPNNITLFQGVRNSPTVGKSPNVKTVALQ